mmetsp:Transcript_6002/g.23773  ORF Transcript_6002/g.23773 Transcript_6002/m.23773 type:complete len:368 (-) Transcript_6002:234-1337(-)
MKRQSAPTLRLALHSRDSSGLRERAARAKSSSRRWRRHRSRVVRLRLQRTRCAKNWRNLQKILEIRQTERQPLSFPRRSQPLRSTSPNSAEKEARSTSLRAVVSTATPVRRDRASVNRCRSHFRPLGRQRIRFSSDRPRQYTCANTSPRTWSPPVPGSTPSSTRSIAGRRIRVYASSYTFASKQAMLSPRSSSTTTTMKTRFFATSCRRSPSPRRRLRAPTNRHRRQSHRSIVSAAPRSPPLRAYSPITSATRSRSAPRFETPRTTARTPPSRARSPTSPRFPPPRPSATRASRPSHPRPNRPHRPKPRVAVPSSTPVLVVPSSRSRVPARPRVPARVPPRPLARPRVHRARPRARAPACSAVSRTR